MSSQNGQIRLGFVRQIHVAKMPTFAVLLVVILIDLTLSDREWHLEYGYDRTDLAYYESSIFSSRRICKREKNIKIRESRRTRPQVWSNLVDEYIFFSPKLISEAGAQALKDAFFYDSSHRVAHFGLLILIVLMIVFGILAIFIASAIGIALFRFFFQLYIIIKSSGLRKHLRTFVIKLELCRRGREDRIIAQSYVQKQPPKRRYRMMDMLRDHSDEELPPELVEDEDHYQKFAKSSSSSSEVHEQEEDRVPSIPKDPSPIVTSTKPLESTLLSPPESLIDVQEETNNVVEKDTRRASTMSNKSRQRKSSRKISIV